MKCPQCDGRGGLLYEPGLIISECEKCKGTGQMLLEPWVVVWRNGVGPALSTAGLEALRTALETDDYALEQGCITDPPDVGHFCLCPVASACAIGYAAWKGDKLASVGEVGRAFAETLGRADELLGAKGGCGVFINAFDAWPRREMIAALLPEVIAELERRANGAVAVA